MSVVAELQLDVRDRSEKVWARLHMPLHVGPDDWTCRVEIDGAMTYDWEVQGVSSMQALGLALKCLASVLYSSELYESGDLGSYGEFGGYLGLPAPQVFSEVAPFPF